MNISFNQFEKEVWDAIDKWVLALKNRSNEVDELKQSANDLIDGWKASYPRKINEISDKVSDYLNNKFSKF